MFLSACFWLNVIGLSRLVAAVRRLLYLVTQSTCREGSYDAPDKAGYRGWISHPRMGVLAFRTLHGDLLFCW